MKLFSKLNLVTEQRLCILGRSGSLVLGGSDEIRDKDFGLVSSSIKSDVESNALLDATRRRGRFCAEKGEAATCSVMVPSMDNRKLRHVDDRLDFNSTVISCSGTDDDDEDESHDSERVGLVRDESLELKL